MPYATSESLNSGKSNTTPSFQVILKDNNTFQGNHADIRGGAISFRSLGFKELDNSSIYSNNTANVHSARIASFATKIRINYDEVATKVVHLETLSNKTFLASLDMEAAALLQLEQIRELDPDADFLQIPSGQKFHLSIDLLDDQGRIQGHENTASAFIRMDSVQLYIDHLKAEKKQAGAPAMKTENNKRQLAGIRRADVPGGFLTNYQANAVNGTFHFPDLIVTQSPGTLRVIEFTISALDDNGIHRSFVARP